MKAFFTRTLRCNFTNFATLRHSLRKLTQFQRYSASACADIANSEPSCKGERILPMQATLQPAVEASEPTRFVEMVFPEQANHYGTLFGGNALSLMGKAAFVAGTRRARCAVVMAISDKVQFHEPVRVGELVELTARVERVGRSSMTVVVDMIAETLVTGRRRVAVRGSFEMVAVDEHGRPTPVASPPPDDIQGESKS
jgi:acyl-CoA hydrolase